MGTFLKSGMAKGRVVLLVLVCLCVDIQTLMAQGHPSTDPTGMTQSQTDDRESVLNPSAEAELQNGTALTRQGAFLEAIPHLLASRGRVASDYAANFNLALCYVATGQSQRAIPVLTDLRSSGHDKAEVNNLLAQAYVGDAQDQKALEATRRAAALSPAN